MSDLNKETIKTLCKLSRISVTDEEAKQLFCDLKRVVDHIEKLNELDVSDLTPYAHMDEQGIDALREDKTEETMPRETFLKNSPDCVGGMIRVPTVIKDV
ncbi:MAG: Aspartyl/glutamyl-tRNA(Asn/Gln) amidotransferase subunit C [Chlamydiales bacterium]|nr:Aspartyl/glutamyl-tRNA(Asn/Gln) amidotransferase subunit C [Chlamydiales bacterium]MCH9620046.1 Aspartyl/glutamyl-tRNA(Asn/Gln) amidotransferase subunit C [Chlamydiales bacterium]MCH9623535.1 Aspartyl/glutamyl-tRNA(Asn/Gln) amidotransferase subunit C [Chlamydiales bacterium]